MESSDCNRLDLPVEPESSAYTSTIPTAKLLLLFGILKLFTIINQTIKPRQTTGGIILL